MIGLRKQGFIQFIGRLALLAGILLSGQNTQAQSNPPFNTLATTITNFQPSTSTLPGLPTTTFLTPLVVTLPTVGYQSGDLVNGKVLYYPWEVLNGSLASGIPHGVILSYNAGVKGFGSVSNGNWSFFDMTTLINDLPYTAAG